MQTHLQKQYTMIAIATLSVLAMLFALLAGVTQEHTPVPHQYVLSTMVDLLR